MNYFELFELPFDFLIDPQQLSKHYRELQKSFHPDQYVTASAQQQRLAVERSSQINLAYQTLADPILRAEYMVNQSLASQQVQTELVQETIIHDHDFLMQQMMLRERLESIVDAREPMKALMALSQEVDLLYTQGIAQLKQCLSTHAYQDALSPINQLKIIKKLQQQIENLEDDFLDM